MPFDINKSFIHDQVNNTTNMKAIQKQIADCLKETVGQYYEFDDEELIKAVEKLYNVFTSNNQKQHL